MKIAKDIFQALQLTIMCYKTKESVNAKLYIIQMEQNYHLKQFHFRQHISPNKLILNLN